MKILFWGGTNGNVGPANINKGIVSNLTDRFYCTTAAGKYRGLAEALWKLVLSDALVVSGISRKGCILVATAKLLGKRSVYIMHGCAVHENTLNNRLRGGKEIQQERFLLENADLLLPVSRKFMHWVHIHYPQYASKTEYLFNGIDKRIFERAVHKDKVPGSIAVSGGVTPLKNNAVVAQAVEALDGKAVLKIYGTSHTGLLPGKQHSRLISTVPNEIFLQHLAETQLFVLNALFESFSIATIEALACGCSILISEMAGVTDLLALEETDMIHDPMDAEEIRGKIEYLLEHPNNERILSRFDTEEWTFEKMVTRLEKRCAELIQNQR